METQRVPFKGIWVPFKGSGAKNCLLDPYYVLLNPSVHVLINPEQQLLVCDFISYPNSLGEEASHHFLEVFGG